MDANTLVQGIVYYIVFLFSTTLHEAAHAWAAKRGGDLTAYHGGQVSLDPTPHIMREPFGMVLLPILSVLTSGWPFGFASAPYDPRWALRYPKRAAWMAIAGPAANLALVALSIAGIWGGVAAGVFHAPDSARFGQLIGTEPAGVWRGVAAFVSALVSMNLLLFCLNMLPVPPLDGSAAILLFMPESTANRYQEMLWGNPMFSLIGMLVAWQLIDAVFQPVFVLLLQIVYPGAGYG